MLCGSFVKIKKLPLCASPCAFVFTVVGVKIGFVPDFPVFDIQIKAVSPTVIIMTNNMLANYSPFFKILGRYGAVFFYLVFYGLTQSEKGLGPGVKAYKNRFVCAGKIIGIRIFRISVKIWKYGCNIMGIRTAVYCTAQIGIMVS